jgi:hypothetical protein
LRLGLQRLVVAGVAIAAVTVIGTRTVAIAVDAPPSWTVTVGPATPTLFPGTAATMPYEVRNTGSGPQRLRGTTVEVKNDGTNVFDTNANRYVDGCLARWFRVTGNDVATDDVAPGATVHGSIGLVFDAAPQAQDACQSLGLAVVVSTS